MQTCKSKTGVIIAICLVVILIAGFVNVAVCTDGGKIVVKEVVISPYGSNLAASVYIPRWALETDENGEILYKKGKPIADSTLRDTENVPLREDIDEYFQREVLPYAPDSWIDKTKTKTGYEIPMTRYFYRYEKPESTHTILERIITLEEEISTSLKNLFGE